jgi:hypothetical protein
LGVLGVLVIGGIVCGVGLMHLFDAGDQQASGIPTIKAEMPIKQRPEQPGGIDIPHQDVTVFQKLDESAEAPAPVEHLLPPPEAPQHDAMPASGALSPLVDSTAYTAGRVEKEPAPADVPLAAVEEKPVLPSEAVPVEAPVAEAAMIEKPVAEKPSASKLPVEKPAIENQAVPKATSARLSEPLAREVRSPQETSPVVKAPEPKETPKARPREAEATVKSKDAAANSKKTTPESAVYAHSLPADLFKTGGVKKTAETSPATTKGGRFRVGLASFGDEPTARREMARLQKSHASALHNVKLVLIKASLPNGRAAYRVQSVVLDESAARKLCADLTRDKQSCQVQKP